jgi:SAM-dependent methyltransferase
MRTPFRESHFDCITSLSVIEHGVDVDQYFGEMARILRPAGVLLTSTDYWPRKIRTWAVPRRRTFGLRWQIFSEREIRDVVGMSHRHGFTLLGPVDFSAQEAVVHFLSKAYTFVAFALEKPAP